jgi:hypothetical protein
MGQAKEIKEESKGNFIVHYNCLGGFLWQIVKLSATIRKNEPQMVFCNQDIFWDADSSK